MNDEPYQITKCVNCNGYGTIGRDARLCPACKGKGIIIIDKFTGKVINSNDDENENNTH